MFANKTNTLPRSSVIVLLLLFFFIDEVAFILYNISFFQFMCATTFSLFFTDEIPAYTVLYFSDIFTTFYLEHFPCFFEVYCSVPFFNNESSDFFFNGIVSMSDQIDDIIHVTTVESQNANTYYKVKLEATNVKKHVMSFYPLQQYIYTIPGESSLIFYRLENKANCAFHTLSVYVTTPAEAVAYIKKLQCFCYEELLVAPHSIIDLPILFSIDEEILNEEFKEITINYILLLK